MVNASVGGHHQDKKKDVEPCFGSTSRAYRSVCVADAVTRLGVPSKRYWSMEPIEYPVVKLQNALIIGFRDYAIHHGLAERLACFIRSQLISRRSVTYAIHRVCQRRR